MIANQTLVANDGYEVCLFPLNVLHMTQDEGGDFSHEGTYNIDLVGTTSNAPLYAPVTMRVVATSLTESGGNNVRFQSVNKVHLANGNLDYLTIEFSHDNNPPVTTIGQVVNQGQLCYHTGTYGYVTGDHVHTCAGQGVYQGITQRPPHGWWDLTNRIHYWDACYINDTTVINGYGHEWKTWDEPPAPTEENKRKFPFIVAKHHWWRTKNLYR